MRHTACMTVRLHVPLPLAESALIDLPPDNARHVQVLRLQPGDALLLFGGDGAEWEAEVTRMSRREVEVRVGARRPLRAEAELPCAVTLAVGMPANERMDSLVEKAAELGAAALQPLQCQRGVLRLEGERAERRRAHWQAVATSAAEQSGRTRVPAVAPVATLPAWLASLPPGVPGEGRGVLSFAPDAQPLARAAVAGWQALTLLSGPEGGLDATEEALARRHGFVPVSLGARVLRADTAPLAALAWLALQAGPGADQGRSTPR
jgi:16S rRNA (uracil1498-N3)-methyltransferase